MRAWLSKVLSHPTAAATIGTVAGGIILAALGLLWSASHFSFDATVAWSAAKQAVPTFVQWMNAPPTMSRAIIAFIICVVVVGYSLALLAWFRSLRRRMALERRLSGARIDTQSMALEEKLPLTPPVAAQTASTAKPKPILDKSSFT
jgi:hypothetical protein